MGITVLVVTHEHELVRRFNRRTITLNRAASSPMFRPASARGTRMKISTFGFLTRRGVRNLGKHWAMTIACIASLSVCMTLNIFASLIEVNVDSMVSYLGSQNEMVVYVDPEADDATIQSVGNALSGTAGVSRVQYMSKEDVLNQYKGYMSDYAALLTSSRTTTPLRPITASPCLI